MTQIRTLAEWLDDPTAELVDTTNERWSIKGFDRQVRDIEERLMSVGCAHLRTLRCRLSDIFFPSLNLVTPGASSSEAVLNEASAKDPRSAPSALIPLWFELHVLWVPPIAMDTPQLERFSAHSAFLLSCMSRHHTFYPLGAKLLQSVAAIHREAGAFENAQKTIDAALCLLSHEPEDADILQAHVTLLEALYDNLCTANDEAPPIKDELRENIAVERLKFLDERLEPALNKRDNALNTCDLERKRSHAALEHRRLTWQASLAAARREFVGDRDEKLHALARIYDEVGEPQNAAAALSVLIDDALDIIERRPAEREGLCALLSRVAEELVTRLGKAQFQNARDRRQLLRRVAEAYAIAEPSRALPFVNEALESIQRDLDSAQSDTISRSVVLSDADDWLGILLSLGLPPSNAFEHAYEVLRGRPLEQVAPHPGANLIRWHVTRRGSAGVILPEESLDATWFVCQEAHELARTLNLIRALSFEDVENFRKKKALKNAEKWKELLERLSGQLAVTSLARHQNLATGRWVIETDGLGVHVPLAGTLLKVLPDTKAIAATKLGKAAKHYPPIPQKAQAVVVNGFSSGEPLHTEVERYAKLLNATSFPARTVGELRSALANTEMSLVVIGCHGQQSSVTGPLVLDLPAGAALAEEVFKELQLRTRATVVAITCFAAAGASSGENEWGSLTELMLRAGARAVVANRWHAWFDINCSAFQELLKDLLRVSVAHTAWPTAEAATAFMSRVSRTSADPRKWCGWAAWTRQEHLVELAAADGNIVH